VVLWYWGKKQQFNIVEGFRMCKEPITDVIFRIRTNGDVVALFVRIPADYYGRYCVSYEQVGQHGGASALHVIADTRLATEEEYKVLKDELEAIGYRLKVRKRYTRRDMRICVDTSREYIR
jgi:hypothetical protein